jgi:hypothetical protein
MYYLSTVTLIATQRRNSEMFAHIYKARGGFTLIISRGAEINQGVVSTALYADRKSAKAAAKAINAKPWNY